MVAVEAGFRVEVVLRRGADMAGPAAVTVVVAGSQVVVEEGEGVEEEVVVDMEGDAVSALPHLDGANMT